MSKKLISATLLALFFSSAAVANVVPGDEDASAPEMKFLLMCDGTDGDAVLPTDAS